MADYILHVEWKQNIDRKGIFSCAEKFSKEENEENTQLLKRAFLDIWYKFIERYDNKRKVINEIDKLFVELKEKGVNMFNVLRTNELGNIQSNLRINYHIEWYKNTNSKIKKDTHYIKIHELTQNFVIDTVRKENFWNYDEDLESAGFMWVLKSVTAEYDPTRTNFLTYAFPNIRSAIQRERWKINPGHYSPYFHHQCYITYRKEFKNMNGHDEVDHDKNVIKKVVKDCKNNGQSITENLLSDIVAYKLNAPLSIDWRDSSDTEVGTILETLESDDNIKKTVESIDNQFFREEIMKWLWQYTDFEKTILERRFGLDLGKQSTYPVYTMKVTRDGIESSKEMIAVRCIDAISRAKELWYTVLSTKDEVEKSKEMHSVMWSTLKQMKEYFEVMKCTPSTTKALKKNEDQLIKQMKWYFNKLYEMKGDKEPHVTFNV